MNNSSTGIRFNVTERRQILINNTTEYENRNSSGSDTCYEASRSTSFSRLCTDVRYLTGDVTVFPFPVPLRNN